MAKSLDVINAELNTLRGAMYLKTLTGLNYDASLFNYGNNPKVKFFDAQGNVWNVPCGTLMALEREVTAALGNISENSWWKVKQNE